MAVKVGINGLGRIGRLAFRAMITDPEIEIVAINDLGPVDALAHLLKYDSVHGRAFQKAEVVDGNIVVDGHEVKVFAERDPKDVPWAEVGVEVVIESTGAFKSADTVKGHLEAGAKKVIVSDYCDDADITIVMGVNDDKYDAAAHNIISAASCTTTCLAPLAKVFDEAFGIKRGYMNTIRAFANDQKILDLPHKDLRRARAAAISMIPVPSDSARAVAEVLPNLEGKLDGFATRVPTQNGAMVDLTMELEREVTKEEVNEAVKAAAEGPLGIVLEYTEDPIVSIDVLDNPHSAVFDSKMTMVMAEAPHMVKCVAWHDNEWGYASRLKDLVGIVL